MNGKYLIRRAESDDDAAKLNDLFTAVFHPEDVGALALTMFHSLPRMQNKYWFIAEEKQTSAIVSAFALIPWTWAIQGIRLKVAEMGLVGTLESHRGQGLMKQLNTEFDRTLIREQFNLAVIQGIPGFYNRFGYHYAIALENHIDLPLHGIPDAAFDSGYSMRQAAETDIPFLMQSDEAYRNTYLVSALRDEANWRYLLTESKKTEYGSEFWIVEHKRKKEKYYCRIPQAGFGTGLIVSEISEDISLGATMAFFAFFKQLAIEKNKPYIRLNLHNDSRAAGIANGMGACKGQPYAWQIKVADKMGLLQTIAPLLEKRLAKSCFNRFSQTLRLDFFTSTLDLVWQTGKLSRIQPGSKADCPHHFCISEDLFAALCLGHRTWQELQHIRPDIFPATQYIRPGLAPDPSGLLMDVLFPAGRSWVVEQY